MFMHCSFRSARILDVDDEAVLHRGGLNSQFERSVFGSTAVFEVHKPLWAGD